MGDVDAGKTRRGTTGARVVSKTLMDYIKANGLDPRRVMNELQDNGVCSDTCVEVEDVGNGGQCLLWLHDRDLRGMRGAGK